MIAGPRKLGALGIVAVIAVLYGAVLLGIYFIFKKSRCVARSGGDSGPDMDCDDGTDAELETELEALLESEDDSEMANPGNPTPSPRMANPSPRTANPGTARMVPARMVPARMVPARMVPARISLPKFEGSAGSYNDMDYIMSSGGTGEEVVYDNVAESVQSRDVQDTVRSRASRRKGFGEMLERATSASHRTIKPREQLMGMMMDSGGEEEMGEKSSYAPVSPELSLESRATPQRFHERAGLVGIGLPNQVYNSKVIYPSEDGTWGADVSDPNPTSSRNSLAAPVQLSPEERIMAAQRGAGQ
jgi:hypothetical protein